MLEIIDRVENVIPLHASSMSLTQKGIDIYTDSNGPRMFCNTPGAMTAYAETLSRGVRIRIITEITKENLPFVKEGVQYVTDLRHMDGITHSFTVADRHYMSTKMQYESPYITQTIVSSVGWFVKEHQYLFEILWNKAIPAKQRIKEIEEGVKREFIETLRDPLEIVELVPKVVSSAYEEILVLFPTSNIFKRFESEGIIELIKNRAVRNNVLVRFLLQDEKKMQSKQLKKNIQQNVEAHFVDSKLLHGIKMTLIIVDREKILAIEIKDDLQPALIDSIGLATYSNSESTVISHSSMFEKLWIQSEMKPRPRVR
jgi:two-component system sensor histidine kinase VicK